jgi:valyl-tRNA synthetase
LELSKTFDPKSAEDHWFQLWIDRGYFKADPTRLDPADPKVFSIVIPPPNVTGALHLGHALNSTIHDVIVRTRRMQGFNTLWLPGTDHAGIATQNVVEREIAKDGKSRHDLGAKPTAARSSTSCDGSALPATGAANVSPSTRDSRAPSPRSS